MKHHWIHVCILIGAKVIVIIQKTLVFGVLMVCCTSVAVVQTNKILILNSFPGSNAKSSRYIADEYALQHLTNDEINEYSRHPRNNKHIPTPDYSNQCGRVKISDAYAADSSESIGQFRVISGARTKRGHHPWQATIRARGRNGRSSHWCGAVVVSKNHILTAAHCLIGFPKGAYFVRLGDHHSELYENSEIEIFIDNWSIHEDFRKGQLMNNDIAVIQLKQPIQFTNYIQPICLPTKETKFEAGKNCTISGWGSIQYGKSSKFFFEFHR